MYLCRQVKNQSFPVDFPHLHLSLYIIFMNYALCINFICMCLPFVRLVTKILFLTTMVAGVFAMVSPETDNDLTHTKSTHIVSSKAHL